MKDAILPLLILGTSMLIGGGRACLYEMFLARRQKKLCRRQRGAGGRFV